MKRAYPGEVVERATPLSSHGRVYRHLCSLSIGVRVRYQLTPLCETFTEYRLVPGSAGLIGDDMMKCFGKQSEYPRTAKAQWGEALEHTADIRDSALVHPLRAGHFT